MTPPRHALVIVPRRNGDVLLATPLIRSLRQAWPQAALHALVFAGTEGVIAANPDLDRILTVAERPGPIEHAALLARIARRYDIALSLVPGDRPTAYAWIAGRRRVGLLADAPGQRWKRTLLTRWIAFDNLDTHTLRMHLRLADALDVPRRYRVVAAWSAEHAARVDALLGEARVEQPYAVLHTYPKFAYKMWHVPGWVALARWLAARGIGVVLPGSADAAERAYVAAIARELAGCAVDLCGRLSLAETAYLIGRCSLYAGTDTVTTHMAAALGVPVIALYGPSNPVKWGPWPGEFAEDRNPWSRLGSQTVGNVTLLQGPGACVPCMLEGCERRLESSSDCLQQLPAATVIAAAQRALEREAAARPASPAEKTGRTG